MLETERLILKLLEEKDENDIIRWRNQKGILDNLFSIRGVTRRGHREWFERYSTDDSRIEFVILIRQEGKSIGTVGLSNIDHRNQKAEYGIILGETEEQGKGYAWEASKALISYGFLELNLLKIYLKVFSDNHPAVKLYNKLGFVQEGLLRKDVFKNGKYKDVLVMSIFRDEWK